MAFSKYYFKQPKRKIAQDILVALLVGGALVLTGSSPALSMSMWRTITWRGRYNKRSVENAFYRLRKQGYLRVERQNHRVSVELTEEGRARAGKFQINHLKIKRPKKWDGKWRVVIFDIKENDEGRTKRDALRGFLFRLGFYRLQHSVWIHPFDCTQELALLKEFFGLTTKEVQLLIVQSLEEEAVLRKKFVL